MSRPELFTPPQPLCALCESPLVKGVLDRSGQTYWCPTCAKQDAKDAREWANNNAKWKDEGL